MSGDDEIGRDRLGAAGDEFYTALMGAHEGLSFEDSAALNARLVLILANQVGDLATLKQALEAAREKANPGDRLTTPLIRPSDTFSP